MKPRKSDAWLGGAVVLGAFALVSYAVHVLVALALLATCSLVIAYGLALIKAWHHPDTQMQCLAVLLLTLPMLLTYGIPCAIAFFFTVWLTHVGRRSLLHPQRVPAPPDAAGDA